MDGGSPPNGFELDYSDRANIKRTLEGIFAKVEHWWVKTHGKPLTDWRYRRDDGEGWSDADSGAYIYHNKWYGNKLVDIPGVLDQRTPVCDGKREAGGSMERYLDAHWKLTEFLEDLDRSPASLIAIAVAYGWAIRDMGLAGVKVLDVIQPSEIELPPATQPLASPPEPMHLT